MILVELTSINRLIQRLTTALVTPHIIVLAISVMFGWLTFGLSSSGFALIASILYTVAGVMFMTID